MPARLHCRGDQGRSLQVKMSYNRGFNNAVQRPLGLWHQSHYHNYTKTLFSFFTHSPMCVSKVECAEGYMISQQIKRKKVIQDSERVSI